MHDANTGLKAYHHQFDIVHFRGVSHGIMDYKSFLVEVAACLKPGGGFLAIGADGMGTFNEHKEFITELTPGKEGYSAFNRFTEVAVKAGAVSLNCLPFQSDSNCGGRSRGGLMLPFTCICTFWIG